MGGQAKSSIEIYGALVRRENFEFNYIHDYDVIIFVLERGSSKFKVQSLPTSVFRPSEGDGEDF